MKRETKLLTPAHVAQLLSMKPRTITRWCREGVFPSAHKVGRVWRLQFDDSKLHFMLYQREEKKASG